MINNINLYFSISTGQGSMLLQYAGILYNCNSGMTPQNIENQ